MAAQLGEAFVSIRGEDSGLRSALNNAERATEQSVGNIETRLKRVSNTMSAIGGTMTKAVTLPIVAGLGLATKAAMAQEEAENNLRAALDRTGDAAGGAVAKLTKLASALQKQSVYGDEAILQGMALAKNLGVQTDQLEAAGQAAVGLAARYNIDLNSAFMLIGRAASGNTAMLRRYGIQLDENLSPQEKFNQLLKIGIGSLDLAQAKTRTAAGQLQQMKNALGDTAEILGATFVPYVARAANALKMLAERFQGMSPRAQRAIMILTGIAAAIGPLMLMAAKVVDLGLKMKLLATAFQLAGNSAAVAWLKIIGPIGVAIGAIAALIVYLNKWTKAQDEITQSIDGAAKSMERLSDAQLNIYKRNLELRYQEAQARAAETERRAELARATSPIFGMQFIPGTAANIATREAQAARSEADRLWNQWRAASEITAGHGKSSIEQNIEKQTRLLEQQNQILDARLGLYAP